MKTIATLLLVFCITTGLDAQEILKTIGNGAKNKVEQQDFNTTRSNKEKSNLQRSKQASPPPPAPASEAPAETDSNAVEPASTSGDLNYKESYTFEGTMTYEIEDLKKAKKNNMTYRYANGAIYTEMPETNSCSIYDYENESMIMFDEKAMSATVMSASFMNKTTAKAAENHAEKVGKTTITKTGKTKQILGYNCDNYLSTSEDGSKTDFWVTTELTVDNTKMIESLTKNMNVGTEVEGDYPDSGIMMEFTGYDKKGAGETHMIMTAYDKTTFTKALAGYRVTKLAF